MLSLPFSVPGFTDVKLDLFVYSITFAIVVRQTFVLLHIGLSYDGH